ALGMSQSRVKVEQRPFLSSPVVLSLYGGAASLAHRLGFSVMRQQVRNRFRDRSGLAGVNEKSTAGAFYDASPQRKVRSDHRNPSGHILEQFGRQGSHAVRFWVKRNKTSAH